MNISRSVKGYTDRKKLVFADNSYDVYMSVVLKYAFSKFDETSVKVCTKHKSNFIVRICLYFIHERIYSCVGFQIFNSINATFKPVHVCTLYTDIKYFVSNYFVF